MGKKVTGSGQEHKPIRLLDEEVPYVGVDVHKRSYHVAVWTERRLYIASWVQPPEPALLCDRLEPIRERIGTVAYEAGPTGYSLFHALEEKRFPAQVIAPSRTPSAPGRSSSSDRLSCHQLAFLAGKSMLCPIYVPTREQEADRQVVRRRDQVVGDCRRAKQRIKSFLLQHGIAEPEGLANWSRVGVESMRRIPLREELRLCLDSLLDQLDHLSAQVKELNRALVKLAQSERHDVMVTLLRGVPGVGLLTALTFSTELPEPRRFPTARHLAAYLGLAPWTSSSGESSRSGPLMKAGNKRLRAILVEVSWQWKRNDPAAQAIFNRLLRNTGSSKKAICGVARRLAILLWRIATTGEVYVPGPPDRADQAEPVEPSGT